MNSGEHDDDSPKDQAEISPRSVEEIVYRAVGLFLVAVRAEGQSPADMEKEITAFGAADFFTAEEKAFLAEPAPGEQICIPFSWRYESLAVLLWSLGFLHALPELSATCNVAGMAAFIRHQGTSGLIANAQPRAMTELLEETDRIYDLHWSVRDARRKGAAMPEGMTSGIVYERHYALNWLTRYMNQEWDEVKTDT